MASVWFTKGEEAQAYVEHINNLVNHEGAFKIKEQPTRVALAKTPSYPLRPSLVKYIEEGVTRCLAIPYIPINKFWDLVDFLKISRNSVEHVYRMQGVRDRQPSDNDEEWTDPDEEETTLHVAFRDIEKAVKVFQAIRRNYRFAAYRGVGFAPDPCAGSLNEIQG
jgi:hypothetical protein